MSTSALRNKMTNKGSVLIVDDEPVIRKILAQIVTRKGWSVTEAIDGLDALEKLESTSFDIVISDIKMPRLDGMELLVEVKARYPQISVILITGHGGEYSSLDILAAGADYFITKPFKNVDIACTLQGLYLRRLKLKQRC